MATHDGISHPAVATDESAQYKWLIDRSDRLRQAVASGAGSLVSACSLLMTALGVILAYVVKELLPTTVDHIWPMRVLIGGLALSWLLMVPAVLYAVSALAATHGFLMTRSPKENGENSISDVTQGLDFQHFSSSLRSHLEVATSFQLGAQMRLRKSLYLVAIAIVMPWFGFLVAGLFVK